MAARDFISIDITKPLGQALKNWIETEQQSQDKGARILREMAHMNDGSNFTDIETYFGLPAGKGQIVFDLVNGTMGSKNGAFQVNDSITLTEKVG